MKKEIKKEEVNMTINFKVMRLSWVFLILSLLVWTIIDVSNDNFDSPAIILLALQGFIFWISKIYYTKKELKG